MSPNFNIEFENSSTSVFYAGQIVRGVATFELKEQQDVKGVRLEIRGYADTKWSEGKENSKSDNYGDHEDLLSETVELVKPEKSPKCTLEVGTHRYEFKFQLPENCPPSLKTKSAHIQYFIKIVLVRPWKFNQSFTKKITVLNILDLKNEKTLMNESINAAISKTFGLPFLQSAPLNLEVNLPQSAYIPGQTIPITLSVQNESDVPIKEIKISLYMKTIAQDFHKFKTKTDFVLVSKMKGEGVMIYCKKIFDYAFEVPTTPATCLHLCRIIQMSYELHIQAIVKGLHLSPVLIVPVTIGSSSLKEIIKKQKELEAAQGSSKGSVVRSHDSPPSYEDANFAPPTNKTDEKHDVSNLKPK